MKYNIPWLTDKFDKGETIKYIFFWGHTNKNGEEVGKFVFSQWFYSPFVVEGIEYKTTEHWMMAHKAKLFGDQEAFDRVIKAEKAPEVKAIGREIRNFDEVKWNAHKYEIVKQGSIHKFSQNEKLKTYLLETSDRLIVEASPTDAIWGIGLAQDAKMIENPYTWRGLNLLGFALMETRDFLKEFGNFDYTFGEMSPPWIKYFGVDPLDMFWRMGEGEQYIIEFGKYFDGLSDREKVIYQLSHPATGEWVNFYK